MAEADEGQTSLAPLFSDRRLQIAGAFKKFLGNQLRQHADLRRSLLCQYDTHTATVHDWAKEQPFHAAAIKGLTQSEFVTIYLCFLEDRVRRAESRRGSMEGLWG